MNDQILQIVLASDESYVMQTSILITSLFSNNSYSFDHINIHLLSNNISENSIEIIKTHIPKSKGSLKIYNISDIHSKLGVKVPNTISISSYSRLFISSFLNNSIEKVIYFDVDAIVNGSLLQLWRTNIDQYYVAGVLDDISEYTKKKIGLNKGDNYINAGMLLINLKLWRADNLEQRMLKFLKLNNGNVYHHDQGIINAISQNKIKILPPQYNIVTNYFVLPYNHFKRLSPFYDQEEFELAKKTPIFIHFTAGVAGRPWHRNCRHPLKNLYIKYKNETYYKDVDYLTDLTPYKIKFLSALFYNAPILYKFTLKLRSIIKE